MHTVIILPPMKIEYVFLLCLYTMGYNEISKKQLAKEKNIPV